MNTFEIWFHTILFGLVLISFMFFNKSIDIEIKILLSILIIAIQLYNQRIWYLNDEIKKLKDKE